MSDNFDIRELLDKWPYDPDNDARTTHGSDGRPILQVRTPLGIEQYEMNGRPDGKRPHDRASALDYQLERLAEATAAGRDRTFKLSAAECAELFAEGTLYYYRYLHLFQLRDWQRTVRDTERNIRLFDLVRAHGERKADRFNLEKWRPYILRMHAMAKAMLHLEASDFAAALAAVNDAVGAIESLPELDDDTFKFEQDRSLNTLKDLASQIEKNRPLTVLERLERDLREAVAAQEFERAAQLRDRIRDIRKQSGA